MLVGEQGSCHKARANVGESDGQPAYVCQLFKRLQIHILIRLRSAVGSRHAQTFGARYRCERGNVSASVGSHIGKGGINHSGKSVHIGGGGTQVDFRRKIRILLADARSMEIEVHSAHFIG